MTKKNKSIIEKFFEDSAEIILNSKILSNKIELVIEKILVSLKNNGKIVAAGNGGSAADAQHFVAEFIGRYKKERDSIPALALTTDTSIITAIGNDFSFEEIFSRQCESLVDKNDIFFAISTSGNSENILKAAEIAKKKKAIVIGLTGEGEGKLESFSDIILNVPSTLTPNIQEVHRVILHVICDIVESKS